MIEKKFVETIDVNDWEVLTDNGWEDIVKIHKTIPYTIWEIHTKSFILKCADNHIVFKDNFEQIFVKDLVIGDSIITENGLEEITFIKKHDEEDNMYDMELGEDTNHRYYTNGILSHNTITTSIYILWYAMKYDHKDIIMTSYCERSANEILNGIKLLYEYCPDFIKCGVSKLNESEIIFVNGSRIMSRPTTVKAARGTSPAIIYCDEFAFVGPSMSAEKTRTMQEEFYSAISPALSSSHGKLFITSTPITETDMFYELWSGAINKTDPQGIPLPKEYIIKINGELYRDFHLFKTKDEAQQYIQSLDNNNNDYEIVEREPPGINGFTSQLVTWDKCPLKTQDWAVLEKRRIGESKFAREYMCLSGKNIVKIQDDKGKIIDIPIDMLYNYHME